jgi:flavodoxin
MKTLITYYSRTGITKKAAEKLAGELNAELAGRVIKPATG